MSERDFTIIQFFSKTSVAVLNPLLMFVIRA